MDQHAPERVTLEAGRRVAADPVCGMTATPGKAVPQAEFGGRPYFFCSAKCREKFLADPGKYLKVQTEPPDAAPGVIYTCPMHPQIRQDEPGNCPICGMALE